MLVCYDARQRDFGKNYAQKLVEKAQWVRILVFLWLSAHWLASMVVCASCLQTSNGNSSAGCNPTKSRPLSLACQPLFLSSRYQRHRPCTRTTLRSGFGGSFCLALCICAARAKVISLAAPSSSVSGEPCALCTLSKNLDVLFGLVAC